MKTENKTAMAVLPDTKEMYEAPLIQSVEVEVEQGFLASLDRLESPTDDASY